MAPRFNCTLEVRSLSCVCVSSVQGLAMNRARILEVPFLTNTEQLEQGEELILDVLSLIHI